MRYVIRNKANKKFYWTAKNKWTKFECCTRFPNLDITQKQKDVLEHNLVYFDKLEILEEEYVPANILI